MPRAERLTSSFFCALLAALAAVPSPAAPEYNPVPRAPVTLGPEASRLIVGFRATAGHTVTQTVTVMRREKSYLITQAQSSAADVESLTHRTGIALAASRQITPSMHVLSLPRRLYGADILAVLAKLRQDPSVAFAVIDGRRYALGLPDDPLFEPTPGVASGQWYLKTPSSTPVTLDGEVQTLDLSAVDAVSAWGITTGGSGIVIADVDTGVLFDHPDLERAGLGGRLLPGYDFVGEDEDPTNGAPLGTYLIANDGDGWDPDPSDPGDWISNLDLSNSLFASDQVASSSWHGTRVVGIFGAITNNDVGIAGTTWASWVLPVRALGKGGGYDSDIIAGMQWAAGLSVTNPDGSPLADNPYPADIINLSIGGSTETCASEDGMAYRTALTQVTAAGALVVIAAGNGTGTPVDLPGNCAGTVAGVIAVAGLRNLGTKVGFSSIGPQVSVSAPAGNCINGAGLCLRSIDTTTNAGTTVPGTNGYTDETNPNLGTSFAAPIVSGIAALMRSVNGNLTPSELAARIESSARAFPPNTGNIPVCPALATDGSDECACVGSGQCGAGMANAYQAVLAAQRPIAAVAIPSILPAQGAVLDASGSAASCGRSIASYAWQASGGVAITGGAAAAKVTIMPGAGTLTVTVTDNMGGADTASIAVTAAGAASSAPASAGTAACPKAVDAAPTAPTVTQSFAPANVAPGTAATLTLTLNNANPFVLTQTTFTDTLPAGLAVAASPAPATTCTGAHAALSATGSTLSLSDADIPRAGACTVTIAVSGAAIGSFTNSVAAGALVTGPGGANTAPAVATLNVSAPHPPAVSAAFAPASVVENATSTLTITLGNSNSYAFTSVGFESALPGGLSASSSPAPSSTCGGSVKTSGGALILSGGTLPANGSCTVSLAVSSAAVGNYVQELAVGAVKTTPTSANTAAATAMLQVTAAHGGGGGELDGWDILFLGGVLGACLSHQRGSRGLLRQAPGPRGNASGRPF